MHVSGFANTSPRPSLSERLIGGPVGLRRMLERRGPTFIKIGQFLALRPDIISQEYSDELLRLLDDVEPFPWREARAIIEEDLGDPAELFRYINPRPIAAGSMAQIHLAHLKDGTTVAIKVRRPGIEERVRSDLRHARSLARLLRIARIGTIASPQEVVTELEHWLTSELDFGKELSNMQRLERLTRESRTQLVPQAFSGLCSDRVITAEYVQGIPLTEVLHAIEKGGEKEVQRRGWKISLDDLAQNLVVATLIQIFRYQFFHADVHPGNLMSLPGDAIGYVDFGICEEIDERFREQQVRYLSTVYSGNVEEMFQAALDVLVPGDRADVSNFRKDFMDVSNQWIGRARDTDVAAEDTRSPTAHWLIGVMRDARKNDYQFPARLLAMYRTLLTAETVAHRLSHHVNLRSVGRGFFESLQIDDAIEKLRPETVKALLPGMLEFVRDSPGQINELLSDLVAGRVNLQMEFSDYAGTRRAKDRRVRLLTCAITSVGLAFLLGIPQLPVIWGISVRLLILVLLILLALFSVIQWRRLK
jgi:ubiquinone biosynthesis protein